MGEGELAAIVGPSGSGKTTLLHLMGTLDRPTSGTVRLAGTDVAALGDREIAFLRASRIGFVFQQFFLAEHSRCWTTSPTGCSTPGVRLAERRELALDALSAVGLAAPGGRPARPSYPAASGSGWPSPGHWLASQPSSSPTSPPATSTRSPASRSWRCSTSLHERGATIVLITHDMDIARRMPRRIEMLDGRIVADTRTAAASPRTRPASCQRSNHDYHDEWPRHRPRASFTQRT